MGSAKQTKCQWKTKCRIVIDFRKLMTSPKPINFYTKCWRCIRQLRYSKIFYNWFGTRISSSKSEQNRNPKTVFSTEGWHWEFTNMTFGLKNAPTTFKRLMNSVLFGLTPKQCLVYLSDITIFRNSLEQHNERI